MSSWYLAPAANTVIGFLTQVRKRGGGYRPLPLPSAATNYTPASAPPWAT